MTDRVVVIGGGHNGLVCAAYLARGGRKVTVLEAAERVGGAAITRELVARFNVTAGARELAPGFEVPSGAHEFPPRFKVPAGAHILYGLDPVVAKDLALSNHGLTFARTNLRTVALSPTSAPLIHDGAQIISGDVSKADRAAFVHFAQRMRRFASLLARQHRRVPSRLAWETWSEAMQAATLALDIRRLGKQDMREFLRVATMNVFDVLEETFESPLLKGALAMDAVLGTRLGPRSGHTVLNMLHRWSGGVDQRSGAGSIPRGGMGTVTHAMAAAATSAGAEIRVSSPVAAVVLEGDRAVGVRLATGEHVPADVVVSNVDARQTFLTLLGARHLETEFARRVNHMRCHGTAAKLHLALAGLPRFRDVDASQLGERLLIAPDLQYIENAFNPAKYHECSEQPVLEITIPSVHDETLTPAGQHVLSAVIQYAPCNVEGGWEAHRARFGECVLDVLESYAPGLRALIVGAELLTPADLEREFRITGGHWHHGELTLDQFLMLRPVPGAAQYATPVRDLYLCGAGSHPGGGVMGSAGYNAAHVILRGERGP